MRVYNGVRVGGGMRVGDGRRVGGGVRVGDGKRVGWAIGGVRVGGGILPYSGQTCTCISGRTTLFRGVVSRVGGRAENSKGSSRKKEEKLSEISSFHFVPYFSTSLPMTNNI